MASFTQTNASAAALQVEGGIAALQPSVEELPEERMAPGSYSMEPFMWGSSCEVVDGWGGGADLRLLVAK